MAYYLTKEAYYKGAKEYGKEASNFFLIFTSEKKFALKEISKAQLAGSLVVSIILVLCKRESGLFDIFGVLFL